MSTVLVTGGAGFIGSHLCERLLHDGHRVICVDNFITGKLDNISHLLQNRRFILIKQDVSKYLDIKPRLECVFHFASPASPEDYLQHSIPTLKAGSLGTHNTLGLAKQKKCKFVLASTSEIYGDPLVHPQKENYWGNVNPIGVRGCYDEAKRFSEAITMAYHRVHKIPVSIIRIFNTYGPRMRIKDGRVVPNFIYQAISGRPLTIYGRGKQTRSFCYIDDLTSGIVKCMHTSLNGPVNLGNPCEFSVLELAKIILSLSGSKSPIKFLPLPEDDPRQRKPDISLAKKHLSWSPKVSLKHGLEMTIGWFRANRLH